MDIIHIITKAENMDPIKQQQIKKQNVFKLQGQALSFIFFISLFTVFPALLKQIWPTLITFAASIGQVDLWMFIIVAISAALSSLVVNNLFFLFVYVSKLQFFEQFRIAPQVRWPWQKSGSAGERTPKLFKTVSIVTFNGVVVSFAFLYAKNCLHKLQYKYTVQQWPSSLTIFKNFLFYFTFNQIASYATHRLLHHPIMYPIHKMHHEYNTTISLAAAYAHPIEFVLSNVFSVALGIPILSLITQVHLVSAVPWIYFRLSESTEIHSGYQFPWHCLSFLKGKNKAAFHNFHHSHNSGTYGSMLNTLDFLMGSDKEYKKYYKIE